MCKIGDIILVQNYIGYDNSEVGSHYFVVVSDKNGEIEGLSFNIIGTVMSSFKTEQQRQKKLKYEENLEITEKDGNINTRKLKRGFIKADQLHYFKKSNTNYFVVGQIDGDVLIKLLEKIEYLDLKGKLKQNTTNINESITIN